VGDQVSFGVAFARPKYLFGIGNGCGLRFDLRGTGSRFLYGDPAYAEIVVHHWFSPAIGSLRAVVGALPWIGIFDHPEETRLADTAAIRPFGESNFGHQFRFDKMHTDAWRSRLVAGCIAKRRSRSFAPL